MRAWRPWAKARVLCSTLVAVGAAAGCAAESGFQSPPNLTVCFAQDPEVPGACNDYNPGNTVPEVPEKFGDQPYGSILIGLQNIGGLDLGIENIYLTADSNPYIGLEWFQADPSGANAYIEDAQVVGCSPDRSSLNTPELLPAANPSLVDDAGCPFPIALAGKVEEGNNTTFSARHFIRITNNFDPSTDTPSDLDAHIVLHVDWKEDARLPEGVWVIDVPVSHCGGSVTTNVSSITFPDTQQTQQICVANTGCGPLVIEDVALEKVSAGEQFSLGNLPPQGHELPPQALDSEADPPEVCFDITYSPNDDVADNNAVIITTNDPANPELRVTLATGGCPYSYVLTHEDQAQGKLALDFTGVANPDTAQKNIDILNDGSCPITLQSVSFKAATDQFIQGGPFRIDVYKGTELKGCVGGAGCGALAPVVLSKTGDTAQLVVHFEPNPNQAVDPTYVQMSFKSGAGATFQERVDIVGGEAKAKLQLGPWPQPGGRLGTLWFQFTGAETSKERTVVLFNEGKAPVDITGISLLTTLDGPPAVDFHLVDAPGFVAGGELQPFTIGGDGLVTLKFAYEPQLGAATSEGVAYIWTSEFPEGGEEATPYTLNMTGISSHGFQLPIANPGSAEDYAGAVVFQPIALSGAGSVAGSSAIFAQGYDWQLWAKPEGSAAKLSQTGGAFVDFTADVPGTYRIGLNVFANDGSVPSFSDDAWVDIEVAPAP